MRTRIFLYNEVLGVDTNPEVDGILNDVKSGGQIGLVIKTGSIDITKEAKEAIKNASREDGSFAPMMLTKHKGDAVNEFGPSSFGIMSFGKIAIKKEDILISCDCDIDALDDMTETEIEIPQDFKDFIDNISPEEE